MSEFTVVQVSDLHLSGTHGFFNANWRSLMPRLESAAPAVVVVSGDLTIDGADTPDDLAWAANELRRIRMSPWRTIPGNHDVGEEFVDAAHGQVIDAVRRRYWLERFGCDWWLWENGGWRLIGINSQLLGSGLAAEAAQWAWLEATLSDEPDRPTGIFLHRPLFLEVPEEPDMPGHAVLQVPRQRLLTLVARASVRFIASGHLHQYRARHQGDIEYIWAPSTAFLIADRLPDAVSELGFIALTLRSDGDYAHEFVKAPELRAHNLDALKGHGQYRYLRDIPVEAVGEIMTRHAIVAVV